MESETSNVGGGLLMKVLLVSGLPRLSDDKVCVDNNTAFTVTRLILLCWHRLALVDESETY